MATPITLGKVATAVFKYTDNESGAKKVVQLFAKATEWVGFTYGREADSITSLYKPAKEFAEICNVLELAPKGYTLFNKVSVAVSSPTASKVTEVVSSAGDFSGSLFPTVELFVKHGVVAMSETTRGLMKRASAISLGIGMGALIAIQGKTVGNAVYEMNTQGATLKQITVSSNKIVVAMMKIAMAVSYIGLAVIGVLGLFFGISVAPVIPLLLGTSALVWSVASHFWNEIFLK